MTNGVYTTVLVAITFAICPASNGQYSFGCPPVDDVHDAVTILPNPFNCSTFYICAQGTPLLFVCPGHLQFNYELQVCDYPERANCFELQQYPEPATTNFPAFQPEIEHLLPEQGPPSEHETVPEQTAEPVVLTPEPKPGPSQEGVQPDSQGMVVPSESVDEPLQTRSEEQVDKDDVVEPSEPIGAPEPQPSQEQAEPERQQKDNEGSDDTERELELPAAPADGAPGFELQPAANPTEQGMQDTVATAESIDEPNPARSQEPTESDHETEPHPSKEQAEPESERDINAHSEQELGPAIEPTDSAPEQEPQPTGNPSHTEQQDMVLPAESADETMPARSQEQNATDHNPKRALQPVVSAPESDAQPSQEQAVPELEPEVNEDAAQTQNQQAPATEPNSSAADSEQHLAEKPAKSELETTPVVQQVEPAGEQEQAPSEKLAATTLQPEPQRTDGQAVAETTQQSHDFQHASTEPGYEGVPESTKEPAQPQPQQPDESSEVVRDTTEATAKQTAQHAQELVKAAPEPTAAAPQLEAEATEEPAELVREPSEIVQEEQPSREPEQWDQATEIAQPLDEPRQSAYESTEKSVEPDATEEEAKLAPQGEQSVSEPEQIATKQPIEPKAEHSETEPQLRPTQQPLSGLDEASPNSDAIGTDMEQQITKEKVQSSAELDQSEEQATPKSAEAQPQHTELTQEPQPAPEAEVLEPEATDGTAEHSPSASEASLEVGSEPPAGHSDALETIDEIKVVQTEKSTDINPVVAASDTEADVESMRSAETEPPVSEKAPEALEHKADATELNPDSALSQEQDASTSEPNDPNQDTILQPRGGAVEEPESAPFVPAATDAAEGAPNVAEPTLEPEGSAGVAVAEGESKADDAYEETEKPAVFDDIDAPYKEEGIRSDAVEIDYYT